ncbi:MAG: hypothetical protein STHCBS139747_003236, partial [Sporothrix thermara]
MERDMLADGEKDGAVPNDDEMRESDDADEVLRPVAPAPPSLEMPLEEDIVLRPVAPAPPSLEMPLEDDDTAEADVAVGEETVVDWGGDGLQREATAPEAAKRPRDKKLIGFMVDFGA